MIDFGNIDPAGLVLFTLPVIVLVISFIAQLIFKNELAIIIINFVIWFIAAFTIFNTSFLVYVFIYTLIAILGIVIANLVLKMFERK